MQHALLIEFVCPRCRRSLVWANATASVYCRRCDKWVLARQITEINPAKIDPEHRQLRLF